MEALALFLVLGSVSYAAGTIWWSRHPNLKRSPEPIEIDAPLSVAYERFLNLLAAADATSNSHRWTVLDRLSDAYIIADLLYTETFQNKQVKCNAKAHFDFAPVDDRTTKIRWYYEFKHRCDAKTARRLEGITNDWLRLKLANDANPPAATKGVSETPAELLEKLASATQQTPVILELPASTLPSLTAPKADTQQEASPLVAAPVSKTCLFDCRYPQAIAYKKLKQKLSTGSSVIYRWRIKQELPPGELVAELFDLDPNTALPRCSAIVHFKLQPESRDRTQVSWEYNFMHSPGEREEKSVRNISDEYIRIILKR